MSDIAFEKYNKNGFVDLVSIGVAETGAEWAMTKMVLTHIPVSKEFGIRLIDIKAEQKNEAA